MLYLPRRNYRNPSTPCLMDHPKLVSANYYFLKGIDLSHPALAQESAFAEAVATRNNPTSTQNLKENFKGTFLRIIQVGTKSSKKHIAVWWIQPKQKTCSHVMNRASRKGEKESRTRVEVSDNRFRIGKCCSWMGFEHFHE